MHTVVTLVSLPGTVLNLTPFVTVLGAPARTDWLEESRAADLTFDTGIDATREHMVQAIARDARIDCCIQPAAGREKKLLIADMDSTMIDQECIDELAARVGLKDHVAAITERAMRGELDFKEALRERVSLLNGLAESELQNVFEKNITLMSGAKTLLTTMKARGAYCALVSGGFTFFTSRVASALGFDTNEANFLNIENGALSGTVREPILDKDSKREALHRFAHERGLALSQTLALGDGANDIPMLRDAGLGIAYHAKPVVIEATNAAIRYNDLTAALFYQGIARSEWK